MKIRFLGRSAAQVRAIDAWWREHRGSAPLLFAKELDRSLELLKETPRIGAPYMPRARDGVRRLLLRQTQYHLYYVVDGGEGIINVLAVWSCVRGRPPALMRAKTLKPSAR